MPRKASNQNSFSQLTQNLELLELVKIELGRKLIAQAMEKIYLDEPESCRVQFTGSDGEVLVETTALDLLGIMTDTIIPSLNRRSGQPLALPYTNPGHLGL
ncbi:hypothetical protein Nos7524_3181 [Nostoc sp. PCC 7524]|uniref:hypothetical protein n=1 Tax=Nostoc sp. (strain ATCC 29411 / PCC 7524) TaxID=28072 RepID=UPI00029EEE11|nr:hypothetical protein [Nostoc sp. PCC 7524]AFY48981.1 hypothetical protein Nos7524_3181 [Nostoc sp. PCC 7524]